MSRNDHGSWVSFRGDESLLKRSVVLAAHFCEHNEDHCDGMNCTVCTAYLNTAAVLWKELGKKVPRDALCLMVEYAPHPKPGSKPGAPGPAMAFPTACGREDPRCGPGQTCCFCAGQWTGQRLLGTKGHIQEGAARLSGPPGKDQARGSLSISHSQPSARSIPCRPLSTTDPV